MITPDAAITATGPWTHRNISANGARFHIVEMGSGPTVLLLHGFPSFWWTWRELIAPLAHAGYRVIAMDLRGYGGSDHPPQGYDPTTLARDCVSVIRSLGEAQATVVGHGLGSVVAWTMAAHTPDAVTAVVSVAGAHPRVLRHSLLRNNAQRSGLSYLARLQLPFIPERYYTKNDANNVGEFFEKYSYDPSWLDPDVRASFQAAYQNWPTAHTAIEFHRWAIRSLYRTDGRRFQDSIDTPVSNPVLDIFGEHDPMVFSDLIDNESMVSGPYTREIMPTGHFPHEENPRAVAELLLPWLSQHARSLAH